MGEANARTNGSSALFVHVSEFQLSRPNRATSRSRLTSLIEIFPQRHNHVRLWKQPPQKLLSFSTTPRAASGVKPDQRTTPGRGEQKNAIDWLDTHPFFVFLGRPSAKLWCRSGSSRCACCSKSAAAPPPNQRGPARPPQAATSPKPDGWANNK